MLYVFARPELRLYLKYGHPWNHTMAGMGLGSVTILLNVEP